MAVDVVQARVGKAVRVRAGADKAADLEVKVKADPAMAVRAQAVRAKAAASGPNDPSKFHSFRHDDSTSQRESTSAGWFCFERDSSPERIASGTLVRVSTDPIEGTLFRGAKGDCLHSPRDATPAALRPIISPTGFLSRSVEAGTIPPDDRFLEDSSCDV